MAGAAKYKVNWSLEGFQGKSHGPGDVITADPEEAKHLVALGVLTQVAAAAPPPPPAPPPAEAKKK